MSLTAENQTDDSLAPGDRPAAIRGSGSGRITGIVRFPDGRVAVAFESYAEVDAETAEALGVEEGDELQVTGRAKILEVDGVPVRVPTWRDFTGVMRRTPDIVCVRERVRERRPAERRPAGRRRTARTVGSRGDPHKPADDDPHDLTPTVRLA